VLIAAASPARLTVRRRSNWIAPFGSIYGSGRFFPFLGKHAVNDHVHLHVKLHAERDQV
jgi:hypothetical protein